MLGKKILIVGGSNGIGLAFCNKMLKLGAEKVIIIDKVSPEIQNEKIEFVELDLSLCNYEIFDKYQDIDFLFISAGFGRVSEFRYFTEKEIENSFKVNALAVIQIIKIYYEKLLKDDFKVAVMGSIAGWISSPLFSVYSASKAAVCKFIEAINIELEKSGSLNRVLNVSPGALKGTKFNGGENDLSLLENIISEIIDKLEIREQLYIPDYDKIYKNVIDRYLNDPHQFGIESYEHKINNNRENKQPSIKIGYLSGTFDLFHIGHLNLLKRAKKHCDYLVVGVHKDASHKGKETFIPFNERMEILRNIKFVDKVVESTFEDVDMYEKIKYDYLFVGSDYKGTERFKRYEAFFSGTTTKIVYFPYTDGTSSTQIRNIINDHSKGVIL